MMQRSLLTAILISSAFSMGLSLPAMAQVTDQTDQSEEDWRKSRKKSGSSDIYRTPNTSSTGLGLPTVNYDPPTPLERLPSESRRHIMRERAKAIAESPDGDISQVAYTPSDAAQTDPQLRQDEEEAWNDITSQGGSDQSVEPQDASATGSSPSQSSSQKQGQDQGNGQTGSPSQVTPQSSSQGPRGGSADSLQEIMNSIKSGQSRNSPGRQGSASEGPSSQGSGSQSAGSQGSSSGESSGSDGSGQLNGSTASGGQAGQSSSSSANADLSPLEIIRRSKDERPAEGRKRSASDYIGQESDQTP